MSRPTPALFKCCDVGPLGGADDGNPFLLEDPNSIVSVGQEAPMPTLRQLQSKR